ncbi:unnamed protein product [Allacma fusca]|uniref:Major facilitator superfamily (MFS) profile domain-containing protein n=1 Tax=Allacma fusca TaxID=39272 RepID=A0A8J2J4S3_9HEXA|nr:unnamed protein product [Allacma fusca]
MGGATNEGFEMDDPSQASKSNGAVNTKTEDFDQLLDKVGSIGSYQKIFLYAVLGPITALMPFFSLSSIFILSEPEHWCHVPGRNVTTMEEWKRLTIPMEKGADGKLEFSKCSMYGLNGTVVDCQNGWDYDKENYEFTIPSQFDWVCSKSHYTTTAFTTQTIGSVLGVIVFGYLADKIGRKRVFFLTALIDVVFRTASLFLAHSYNLYLASQFLNYLAYPLLFIAPTIIAAEISGKDYRGWIFGFSWMIWVVGMASLPLAAWLSRTWFTLGMLASGSCALIFLTYPFVPESPRWLLSMGRIEDAARIMEKIAEKNGTTFSFKPDEIENTLRYLHEKESLEKEKSARVGVWTLFSRPRLAKNTLMLGVSWSVNKLVYYGITLNASHILGNEFLIFFILAIIELPAGYFGGILVEKLGRRWTGVIFFFLCAISCFGSIGGLGGSERSFITITCIVIAKFSITLTFLVVYMQGAEIFPTNLRSTGSSFASLVATAVNTVGPYMIFIGKINASLPYAAMGIASLVGLVAAAFIPETMNRKLPETVDQANDFGKDDKFCGLRPADEDETLRRREGKDNRSYT